MSALRGCPHLEVLAHFQKLVSLSDMNANSLSGARVMIAGGGGEGKGKREGIHNTHSFWQQGGGKKGVGERGKEREGVKEEG